VTIAVVPNANDRLMKSLRGNADIGISSFNGKTMG
jgi:hypothetical protein